MKMFVQYPALAIKKGATPGEDWLIQHNTKPPRTGVSSRDAGGTVLWHLWLFYFQDYGWERLKPCPVCHHWFVDTSKNKKTARCSSACTWKWWSRDRRKKMHHRTKGAKPPGAPRPARKASTRCPGSNQKVSASAITSLQLGNRHWETAACPNCHKQCAVSLDTKTIGEHKK